MTWVQQQLKAGEKSRWRHPHQYDKCWDKPRLSIGIWKKDSMHSLSIWKHIQEEHILTAIRSITEQKVCVQDELEEIKHPRKMLDSEIGKIPLCAPLDSVYSQKNNYQESMAEEEVQIKDNEEAQRDLGYIEGWLQIIFKEGKHFLFQQFLASHQRNKMAFHIRVYV